MTILFSEKAWHCALKIWRRAFGIQDAAAVRDDAFLCEAALKATQPDRLTGRNVLVGALQTLYRGLVGTPGTAP